MVSIFPKAMGHVYFSVCVSVRSCAWRVIHLTITPSIVRSPSLRRTSQKNFRRSGAGFTDLASRRRYVKFSLIISTRELHRDNYWSLSPQHCTDPIPQTLSPVLSPSHSFFCPASPPQVNYNQIIIVCQLSKFRYLNFEFFKVMKVMVILQ